MTTGVVTSYDPDKREGYLRPDADADGEEEHIPFELGDEEPISLRAGDRVSYDVEGGLAGIMAIQVRKL